MDVHSHHPGSSLPTMIIGPSNITVKVSWGTDTNVIGSENVTEIKTKLHDEGKSLNSDNFIIIWHGSISTVTAHGEKQSGQSYTFDWKEPPRTPLLSDPHNRTGHTKAYAWESCVRHPASSP